MGPPSSPPNSTSQLTYYDILQITPSHLDSHADPGPALKRAYHRALLIHHPDKKSLRSPSDITIDQVSLAYATLSSPSSRSAYDKLLLTQPPNAANSSLDTKFQTGIQDIDLDDLDYDEARAEWFKSCRCGNERGYHFQESDLEEAADFGEVMVGCQDCSLWLRVRFAVIVDDGEGEAPEMG